MRMPEISLTSADPSAPHDERSTSWAVLLILLGGWGITLRLVLLISVPIVVIVELLVIHLGTVDVSALLTGGGYGLGWFLARRRRRQSSC
jgi:hypothetical protein